MNPWLSILIPSNRPTGLEWYVESLFSRADNWKEIELIILVDDERNYVEIHNNVQTIHYKRSNPLNVSELQNECYRLSKGDWIMLANDDCIMETDHWDTIVRRASQHYPDEVALLYPNDGMFGKMLACFPIVSRKVLEATKFFPQPYRRYKVDDTLFTLFPPHRRLYLENVHQTHHNDQGKEGYHLPNGRIYPIDPVAADYDNKLWVSEHNRRIEMIDTVHKLTGEMVEARILIGIPSTEAVRDGRFYDSLNGIDKPVNTIQSFVRGQSPAKARNILVKTAMENQCTHIMFLDDDMQHPPNIISQLFAHNKDIVTGLYFKRQYPHEPLIFDERREDGSCRYGYRLLKNKGLVEVVNCGFGAVLIKTDVFRKMQEPWVTLGHPLKDEWCDDIDFFNRARDAGFKIYADLDVLCTHITSVAIKPQRNEDGSIFVIYDTNGSGNVGFTLPIPEIMKEKEDGVSEVTA